MAMAKKDSQYESKTLKIATVGMFGRPSGQLKKLEKLIEDGWEVVSQKGAPFGAQTTTFILRRPRAR